MRSRRKASATAAARRGRRRKASWKRRSPRSRRSNATCWCRHTRKAATCGNARPGRPSWAAGPSSTPKAAASMQRRARRGWPRSWPIRRPPSAEKLPCKKKARARARAREGARLSSSWCSSLRVALLFGLRGDAFLLVFLGFSLLVGCLAVGFGFLFLGVGLGFGDILVRLSLFLGDLRVSLGDFLAFLGLGLGGRLGFLGFLFRDGGVVVGGRGGGGLGECGTSKQTGDQGSDDFLHGAFPLQCVSG